MLQWFALSQTLLLLSNTHMHDNAKLSKSLKKTW